MNTITFIQNPPFRVDFNQFQQKPDTVQKIKEIFSHSAFLIASVFVVFAQSTHSVFCSSGASFKQVVLGKYNTNSYALFPSLHTLAFKVAVWAIFLCGSFASTFNKKFSERCLSQNKLLKGYASPEINLSHFKIKNQELDASQVPVTIQVSTLLDLFDQINFTRPLRPDYVPPSRRRPEGITIEPHDLRVGLATFVNNIIGRVPFIGTPPATKPAELSAFYQQIESALRLTLHKVTSAVEEFKEEHGEDFTRYTPEALQKYKNLIEDQTRVVLDCAFAGPRCGGRYMSEAMDLHSLFCNDLPSEELGLQETLFEMLALERARIANEDSRVLAPDAPPHSELAHLYARYMADLGPLLIIPGTEHISEQLVTSLNKDWYLKRFFSKYTPQQIIKVIQDALKNPKGAHFREQVTDWLSDQVGNWKKDEYLAEVPAREALLTGPLAEARALPADAPEFAHFRTFSALIAHLKTIDGYAFPDSEGWQDFLEELFATDAARAWFTDRGITRLQKHDLKTSLSEETLTHEGIERLRQIATTAGQQIDINAFLPQLREQAAVPRVRGVILLEPESIKRIFRGESPRDAILGLLERERKVEFLDRFNLENIQTEGLPRSVIEWLLVSQGILNVQEPL
jgi:hypothetical protein